MSEVSDTLGFETEPETRVVSVPVSSLETSPLKAESQSQCLRPQIKSLSISLTVRDQRQKVSVSVSKMKLGWKRLCLGLNKNVNHTSFIIIFFAETLTETLLIQSHF